MSEIIYGRQPVREVLRAGRRKITRLWVPEHGKPSPDLDAIHELAATRRVPVSATARGRLDRMLGDVNHQGVAVEATPFVYLSLQELAARVTTLSEPAFLVLLDHLEDPQNLGSLLRSADAAGAHAVVIPKDRSAAVTPAVVRASAGAAEHVPVARVTNLVQTMKQLQPLGLWFYGLEGGPEAQPYAETDLSGPVGLVVGNEGRGLKRLVRETCDFLIRLPQCGQVGSLNAAVAGAVAMYEVRRQRNTR